MSTHSFSLAAVVLLCGGNDTSSVATGDLLEIAYNVAPLSTDQGASIDQLSLLAFAFQPWMDEGLDEQEIDVLCSAENIAHLIRQVPDPAIWDEDPRLQVHVSDGNQEFLIVRATEEIHAAIRDLLGFLQTNLAPTERLEIRILEPQASDRAANLAAVPVFVPHAEAADLAETLAKSCGGRFELLAHAGPVRARDRISARMEAGSVRNLVLTYEVEIAESAYVGDPITQEFFAGLTAIFRSSPAPGGTYLEYALRHSGDVSRDDSLPLTSQARFDRSPTYEKPLGEVDLPRMRFTSLAGTLIVPEGHTALLPVTVETVDGPVTCIAALTVSGAVRKVRASLPYRVDQQDRRLELLHSGTWTSGGVGLRALPNFLFDRTVDDDRDSDLFHASVGGWQAPLSAGSLTTLATDGLGGDIWDDSRFSIDLIGQVLVANVTEAQAALLRKNSITAGTPTSYRLEGRVVDADGSERARFHTTTLPYRPCGVWAGVQSHELIDWDVEVANNVGSGRPQFCSNVDGLAMRFVVHPLPGYSEASPSCWVESSGLVRSPTEHSRLRRLSTAATPFLHQGTARVLHVEDGRFAQPGEVLAWNANGMRFELKVTPLPAR
jgi:hypothetical protein